jgi:hypothetical protein
VGPKALQSNSVAKFKKFTKELFRVPSNDVDCTVTANANKEYLRQSEVKTGLTNMGIETGNKFKTQMSKLKTLKLFYDFVRNDPRMASWPVAAHKQGWRQEAAAAAQEPVGNLLVEEQRRHQDPVPAVHWHRSACGHPIRCVASGAGEPHHILDRQYSHGASAKAFQGLKILVVGACMRLRPSD